MKKIVGLCLAIVMALSVAACGSNGADGADEVKRTENIQETGEAQLEGVQKELYDAAIKLGLGYIDYAYEYQCTQLQWADGSYADINVLVLDSEGIPYIVDRETGEVYAAEDLTANFGYADNGRPLFETKEDIYYSMLSMYDHEQINYGEILARSVGDLYVEETINGIYGEEKEVVNRELAR